MASEKLTILNCPCSPYYDENEIAAELTKLVNLNVGGYSVAINALKVLKYSEDSKLKIIIDDAALCYPDGAGAVFGLSLLHGVKSRKMNFPLISLETAEREEWPVFILGTQEELNLKACEKIRDMFPKINIVGRANGFIGDEEKIKLIKLANPKLILIAMGTPLQENFAKKLMQYKIPAFSVGCGGALNAYAGKILPAPQFMIDNNLEWLYRLYKEPSRWKSQILLPLFILKVLGVWIITKAFIMKKDLKP